MTREKKPASPGGSGGGVDKGSKMTPREFRDGVSHELKRRLGPTKAARIEKVLASSSGTNSSKWDGRGVTTSREIDKTLKTLEETNGSDFSGSDIRKLSEILNSQL